MENPKRAVCPSCQKGIGLESKLVWQEHEGFLSLTMAKDPEAILRLDHRTHLCTTCSIKLLSELLKIELEELEDVIRASGL